MKYILKHANVPFSELDGIRSVSAYEAMILTCSRCCFKDLRMKNDGCVGYLHRKDLHPCGLFNYYIKNPFLNTNTKVI